MRFQKRIQILPWVHLNISGSGISLSFGPPGLSVNIGKKGTRVTAGMPGTGISTSHLFSSGSNAASASTSSIEAHHPGIDFSLLPPPPEDDDPLYQDAVSFVVFSRRASVSAVQRKVLVGYARAAALIARMESDGIVSPINSHGSREVIWLGISPLNTDDAVDEIDVLLKECRFAQWLENYLDPGIVGISPMYARAVVVTLTHNRLEARLLADHLNVGIEMAETMIALMAQDGIFPSGADSLIPISRMDINALKHSFELFERQSSI
ncbi:MAG: cell division protein FtsK [Pseudomonas sp.]|nr:cell division protein FtsK [Pseudomonas sp.]